MTKCAEMSEVLVNALGLKSDPVAITLIKKGDPFPDNYVQPEKPVRHCQAIMEARHGRSLIVPSNKQACPVGASSLGLVPLPEKVASGEFHFGLGLYESPKEAKITVEQRPTLEEGSIAAVALSPLSKAKIRPDVVVVTGTPEQVYWLLPAATTFSLGGRITVNMATIQASCADSTVIPYLTGNVNISLGCFGCRKTTDIAPEQMLVGIPMPRLPGMVEAVKKMAIGAIPKSRAK